MLIKHFQKFDRNLFVYNETHTEAPPVVAATADTPPPTPEFKLDDKGFDRARKEAIGKLQAINFDTTKGANTEEERATVKDLTDEYNPKFLALQEEYNQKLDQLGSTDPELIKLREKLDSDAQKLIQEVQLRVAKENLEHADPKAMAQMIDRVLAQKNISIRGFGEQLLRAEGNESLSELIKTQLSTKNSMQEIEEGLATLLTEPVLENAIKEIYKGLPSFGVDNNEKAFFKGLIDASAIAPDRKDRLSFTFGNTEARINGATDTLSQRFNVKFNDQDPTKVDYVVDLVENNKVYLFKEGQPSADFTRKLKSVCASFRQPEGGGDPFAAEQKTIAKVKDETENTKDKLLNGQFFSIGEEVQDVGSLGKNADIVRNLMAMNGRIDTAINAESIAAAREAQAALKKLGGADAQAAELANAMTAENIRNTPNLMTQIGALINLVSQIFSKKPTDWTTIGLMATDINRGESPMTNMEIDRGTFKRILGEHSPNLDALMTAWQQPEKADSLFKLGQGETLPPPPATVPRYDRERGAAVQDYLIEKLAISPTSTVEPGADGRMRIVDANGKWAVEISGTDVRQCTKIEGKWVPAETGVPVANLDALAKLMTNPSAIKGAEKVAELSPEDALRGKYKKAIESMIGLNANGKKARITDKSYSALGEIMAKVKTPDFVRPTKFKKGENQQVALDTARADYIVKNIAKFKDILVEQEKNEKSLLAKGLKKAEGAAVASAETQAEAPEITALKAKFEKPLGQLVSNDWANVSELGNIINKSGIKGFERPDTSKIKDKGEKQKILDGARVTFILNNIQKFAPILEKNKALAKIMTPAPETVAATEPVRPTAAPTPVVDQPAVAPTVATTPTAEQHVDTAPRAPELPQTPEALVQQLDPIYKTPDASGKGPEKVIQLLIDAIAKLNPKIKIEMAGKASVRDAFADMGTETSNAPQLESLVGTLPNGGGHIIDVIKFKKEITKLVSDKWAAA